MFALSLFVEAVALWYWRVGIDVSLQLKTLTAFQNCLASNGLSFLKNLDFAFLNKPVTLFWSILYVDMLDSLKLFCFALLIAAFCRLIY